MYGLLSSNYRSHPYQHLIHATASTPVSVPSPNVTATDIPEYASVNQALRHMATQEQSKPYVNSSNYQSSSHGAPHGHYSPELVSPSTSSSSDPLHISPANNRCETFTNQQNISPSILRGTQVSPVINRLSSDSTQVSPPYHRLGAAMYTEQTTPHNQEYTAPNTPTVNPTPSAYTYDVYSYHLGDSQYSHPNSTDKYSPCSGGNPVDLSCFTGSNNHMNTAPGLNVDIGPDMSFIHIPDIRLSLTQNSNRLEQIPLFL